MGGEGWGEGEVNSFPFCLLALLAACATERPLTDNVRQCVTWEQTIAPEFAQSCTDCHSGPAPAAGYDASNYEGAIGGGQVIAGNAQSPLLTVLSPTTADATHTPLSSIYSDVYNWVVDCSLSYSESGIHPPGIANPASPDFHGLWLKGLGYEFALCESCHGTDFTNTNAGVVACTTCHAGGPTSCTTCHGQPPATGAHLTHVDGGVLAKQFQCLQCHPTPASDDTPGHIYTASGQPNTAPPSMAFGALAESNNSAAKFNRATKTCAVYCHSPASGDTQAKNTAPDWDLVGVGQAACGTCHGIPPSSHATPSLECSVCHGEVIDENRNIIDTTKHIDGIVELGDGSGTCSACHGSPGYPAPPPDLAGETSRTAIPVGAHLGHTQAVHGITVPLSCSDCHVEVTSVSSPGHIDHDWPAQVFPALNGLAAADSATPNWNRGTATCANTYCHGGGAHLSADTTPGIVRDPVWTSDDTFPAACGGCHGTPPVDITHAGITTLASCNRCHSSTIDAFGEIIITGSPGAETSTHINGQVDVQ